MICNFGDANKSSKYAYRPEWILNFSKLLNVTPLHMAVAFHRFATSRDTLRSSGIETQFRNIIKFE